MRTSIFFFIAALIYLNEARECTLLCSPSYTPVCGSDGVTYSSLCMMTLAACTQDKPIHVVSQGACPSTQVQPTSTVSPSPSKECNYFCNKLYRPVCGSDGITYPNACLLNSASCNSVTGPITMVNEGECEGGPGPVENCNQICTGEFKPVCGSDGITYSNLCELERASCNSLTGPITMVNEGECEGGPGPVENCNQACTRQFQPVCGSDGITYSNLCELERASCNSLTGPITMVNEGECEGGPGPVQNCTQACTREFEPVCGSDGITYSNLCELERASCNSLTGPITVVNEGECEGGPGPAQNCTQACTKELRLVCGSDGITYSNLCELERASCNSLTGPITMVNEGECEGGPGPVQNCVWGCTTEFEPVCGSDGITHSNLCELERASCKSLTGPITMVSEGVCEGGPGPVENCSWSCITEFEPMCGSDGITYSNLCELNRASCKSLTGPITTASEGECEGGPGPVENCSWICTAEFQPVCGSDGITYSNLCELNRASCNRPTDPITMVSEGECEGGPGPGQNCPKFCTRELRPVCGSDGITYPNLCVLNRVSCNRPTDPITMVSEGECGSAPSTTTQTPVPTTGTGGYVVPVVFPTYSLTSTPCKRAKDCIAVFGRQYSWRCVVNRACKAKVCNKFKSPRRRIKCIKEVCAKRMASRVGRCKPVARRNRSG